MEAKSWSAVVLFVLLVHGLPAERTTGRVPVILGRVCVLSAVREDTFNEDAFHTSLSRILKPPPVG